MADNVTVTVHVPARSGHESAPQQATPQQPSAGQPKQPAGGHSLPFTGFDAGLLFAAAMTLVAVGARLAAIRRQSAP